MPNSRFKNSIILSLKLLLTGLMLYYVMTLVDTEELKPLLTGLDKELLVSALLVHFIAFYIMSIRWWLILVSIGTHVNHARILPSYYLGLFCNNFLPTSMGGDVIRIAKMRAEGVNTNLLIFSTLSDRIIGLLSIIIMGIIGINTSIAIQDTMNQESLITINIVSCIIFLTLLLAMHSKLRNRIFQISVEKWTLPSKLNNLLVYCNNNLDSLKNNTLIPKVILLSLISQILIIICYYLIGKSLHIELSFMEYVLLVPIVALLSSIPISVGGLGVREGTIIFLLGAVGVSTPNAVSISLLYLAILILVTIPGSIFLLTGKRKN